MVSLSSEKTGKKKRQKPEATIASEILFDFKLKHHQEVLGLTSTRVLERVNVLERHLACHVPTEPSRNGNSIPAPKALPLGTNQRIQVFDFVTSQSPKLFREGLILSSRHLLHRVLCEERVEAPGD